VGLLAQPVLSFGVVASRVGGVVAVTDVLCGEGSLLWRENEFWMDGSMNRLLIAVGFLLVAAPEPVQARWADGCGSDGNPPCLLCAELKAGEPLETQCIWGANRRTSLRDYLQIRLDDTSQPIGGQSPKQRCYGNFSSSENCN